MAGGDAPADVMAAELLRGQLASSNFDDCISNILSARYYGYSGTEIDWRIKDGAVAPHWFITVPFRRFRFAADGSPLFLVDEAYAGEPLKPGSWVWGSNASPMTGGHARSGLLRSALFYSLFKKWSWRDWTIYAEKFGIPLVIGKHDPDASEEDKEQLETTVEDIGEAGQATMSTNMEIDIREAQRGGDSTGLHRAIVAEANNEISRLITGATLTGNTGSTGSYSLAQVHQARAFNLVLADAKMVADVFRRDIARPWAEYNGFEGAALPKLKIHVAKEIDLASRAKIIAELQGLGLEIDSEQVRAEFGLRAPPTPERTLKAPTPPAPVVGAPAPGSGEEPPEDEPEDEPADAE
jgi:phage gp29-like protein